MVITMMMINRFKFTIRISRQRMYHRPKVKEHYVNILLAGCLSVRRVSQKQRSRKVQCSNNLFLKSNVTRDIIFEVKGQQVSGQGH